MFNPGRDYLGEWFSERRVLGIDDLIVVGAVDLSDGSVIWDRYHHADKDGIGVLSNYLEKKGYGAQKKPQQRFTPPNSFVERLRLTVNPFGNELPLATDWQHYDKERANHSTLAWQVLSVEESDLIDQNAKISAATVNSFWLWALNRTVSPLIKGGGEVSWFFPVNLRGQLKKTNPEANHSSGIYFNVTKNADSKAIQKKISTQLKRQSHWGLAYQAQIGAMLGSGFMRFVLNKSIKGSRMVGSLSMLGEWPTSRQSTNNNEAIIICAPGSPMYPIATGVIKWNDQYTVCLRVNSVLGSTQGQTDDMLQEWIGNLVSGE